MSAYLKIETRDPRWHVCPCPNWAPAGTVCHCYSGINLGGGGGGDDGPLYSPDLTHIRVVTERDVLRLLAKPKKPPASPPPPRELPRCREGQCGINPGSGGGGGNTSVRSSTGYNSTNGNWRRTGASMGGTSGAAAMTNGTVKFFNEKKGFGFSKLCPGHPSCLPMGYRDAYPSDRRAFNDLDW